MSTFVEITKVQALEENYGLLLRKHEDNYHSFMYMLVHLLLAICSPLASTCSLPISMQNSIFKD